MAENINDCKITVETVLQEAFNDLLANIEKIIPNGHIGPFWFNCDRMYCEVREKVHELLNCDIDKNSFANFMNDRIAEDKRLYIKKPLKFPEGDNKSESENNNKDFIEIIYVNNLGEIYMEFEDTYLARYVKQFIVERMNRLKINHYYMQYSCGEEVIEPYLFALQHFASYSRKDYESMCSKLKVLGMRHGFEIEIVQLSCVFARAEDDGNLYINVWRI